MKEYIVTVKYQFPAWCDKDGIESEPVMANNKKEAIRIASRQMNRDGHVGTAVGKGLQWLSAREVI